MFLGTFLLGRILASQALLLNRWDHRSILFGAFKEAIWVNLPDFAWIGWWKIHLLFHQSWKTSQLQLVHPCRPEDPAGSAGAGQLWVLRYGSQTHLKSLAHQNKVLILLIRDHYFSSNAALRKKTIIELLTALSFVSVPWVSLFHTCNYFPYM